MLVCFYNSPFFLFDLHHDPLIRHSCIEYLQARLTLETSQPAFSELPFRFAEVAKVILDVLVLFFFFFLMLVLIKSIGYSESFLCH